jgi:hypothetical protein
MGDAQPAAAPTDTPAEQKLPREQANALFVDWFAKAYPGVVESLLAEIDRDGVLADAGLGATEQQEQGFIQKLMDLAQGVVPAYLQYQQQKDVLDIQLERARAGLAPLETGQFAPSVQIGLDNETVQRIADEAGARARAAASSPLPWLLLGGGVLAALAFRKKSPRRRAAR